MKNLQLQPTLRYFIVLIALFFSSCDWPFNIKETDGEVFVLSLSSDVTRIMPSDNVYLSWTEITVDGHFDNYLVERRQLDGGWVTVAKLEDRFQLAYTDTIFDDEDLEYRVGLSTVEGNIVWANESIAIPNTNDIIVPYEFSRIQDAVNSPLVDNDDTILVEPGHYTENIIILGKEIILKSTMGRDTTIIDGDQVDVSIAISNSIIDGFTIIRGAATKNLGGGVLINGNGTIKNCRIQNNFAQAKGGGIYINGNANVYNTFVYSNRSGTGNGIYIIDGSGEIINNTIISNDIAIEGDCNGLVLRNNIVHQSQPDITFLSAESQNGVTIDYSLFNADIPLASNSIVSDPEINSYLNFELSETSPCIDAGHPDEHYNDIDGTRNDMGAHGGPTR